MNIPTRLKFALGILRHPSQARDRLRELSRISKAPSLTKAIPTDKPAEVKLMRVTSTDEFGQRLIDIYSRNPSPYVWGPKTLEELELEFDKGVRYYLVLNDEGEIIGAKAFNPSTKTLPGSVTEFAFRGRGYQLSAGRKLREQLFEEGFREFRTEVLRDNTRIQRLMTAAGWTMSPHPKKPNIIIGTLKMDDGGN